MTILDPPATGTRRKARCSAQLHRCKAVDTAAEPGVFESIVSVFGNVDLQNDRILPGAFAGTLERWKASGDPIPVIWSHQWQDLDAHVGRVLEAREALPGDEVLAGTGLEGNGGLWMKFALDVDEPGGRRLAKLLDQRRVREFSFAYDVLTESVGADGVNNLAALDVLEVGPTLKGANPATQLLAALGDDPNELAAVLADGIASRLAALGATVVLAPPAGKSNGNPEDPQGQGGGPTTRTTGPVIDAIALLRLGDD